MGTRALKICQCGVAKAKKIQIHCLAWLHALLSSHCDFTKDSLYWIQYFSKVIHSAQID